MTPSFYYNLMQRSIVIDLTSLPLLGLVYCLYESCISQFLNLVEEVLTVLSLFGEVWVLSIVQLLSNCYSAILVCQFRHLMLEF